MPFDPTPSEFWGRNVLCQSCKLPIADDQPTETVHFAPCEHKLEEMNGTYHAACARPILSVKRALDMLS